MAKNVGVTWNYGATLEDYPTDFWDDFDGRIESIEYVAGEFGTQVEVFVRPEDYEYEAENTEPPDDDDTEGLPREWWSMGRKEYEISDDRYKVLAGPAPSRNTNAAKGFIALNAAMGGEGISSDLSSLNKGEQPVLHWKRETQKYTIRGEERTTEKLYPSGPAVGKPVDAKGVKTQRTSGRRAKKQDNQDEVEGTVGETMIETAKKRSSRRSSRRSSQNEDSGASSKPTKEQAVETLVNLVGEFGDDGVRRNLLQTALVERSDLIPTDLAKEVAKRATIKAALDSGQIEDEDGVLYAAN